ncbi:14366_t:CDS:2, partial [Gigaspora rosea]
DHHHNYRHKHKKLKDHHHGDIGKHDHEGLHPKHYYFHHFHYEPHKVDSQIVCGDICAISRIRNGWTRLPDVESVVHDKDEKFKDAKEIKD